MERIAKYVENIDDELCDAKKYAEQSLYYKAMGNSKYAKYYYDMANDELKHANYIHEIAVEDVEKLKQVYKPPTEMQEQWDKSHTEYVELVAWIKQMLAM